MEILLIVGDLDNQRDIKRFLHVFCEYEWNQMTQVHRIAAWSPAGIQIERLAFFVGVQKGVEVSVGEKNAATEEMMWLLACQFLESFELSLRDLLRAELVN